MKLLLIILQIFLLCLPAGAEDAPEKSRKKDREAKKLVALKEIAEKTLEVKVATEDVQVRGKHGVRVHVKNNSDRAVLFSGDKAVATIHGVEYKCMSLLGEFDDLSGSQPTFYSSLTEDTGNPVGPAVSGRGLQSVSDLLDKNRNSNRFAKKRTLQQNDQTNFGQRILWPGDSCSGTILFPSSEALGSALLRIPVTSFFNSSDQAEASNSKQGQHKNLSRSEK